MKVKTTVLALMLAMGLATTTQASEKMVVTNGGGLSELSTASQAVLAGVIVTFAYAAYKNRNWHCQESAPFIAPGTNYTQTKFENCVEKTDS